MLVEKYRPRSVEDILGNKKAIDEMKNWIKKWRRGKALMIYGPPGCGKTLSVYLLAKYFNYEVLESTAEDVRSYKALKEMFNEAMRQQSLFFRGKIILIDEIDFLDSPKAVVELIKKSEFPVILVGSDPFKKKLYSVRRRCKILKFRKVNRHLIYSFLKTVCESEGMNYDEDALNHVAIVSNGDVRAALIDIDVLKPNIVMESVEKLGYRGQTENIFNTLRIIFSTKSIENVKIAVDNCEISTDEIFSWIKENITIEYNISETAKSYNYISKGSLFNSRIIKTQSWGLMKYFSELSFFGTALSGKSKKSFVIYQSPMSRKKTSYELDEVLRKISKKLHISKKEAFWCLKLIKMVANENKNILKEFNFTKDDINLVESCV